MVHINQAALAVVAVLTGSHSTLGVQVQPTQNTLVWSTDLCNEVIPETNVADRITGGCARLEFCIRPGFVYDDFQFGYKMFDPSGVAGPCLSPGPTMYMKPGFTYGVVLCSDNDKLGLHPGSNIHTHGLHISGSGNSDDITRHIYPDSCGFYEYAIPENHMGGTHWYHPHLHFHTEDQASGGAVGALIIEEQDFAHTIDASDLNNGAAHQVYNFLTNKETDLIILGAYDTDKNQWMNKNQDNDSLIYNLVEHVWYRLRILTVNPEAEPEIITIPPECDAHAISHDGVYRFNPPKHREDKYYLTGASRVDVAIKCSSVGTFVVTATEGWSRRRRLQVSTGPTATGWADGFGDWDGDQPLAVLQVTAGTGTESKHGPFIDNKLEVGTWPSWRPDYLLDLRQDTPENYFSIEMDNASVNDLEYNEQCPLKDSGQDFDYDTLQEWNHLTVDRHPAHVHIWHQQILSNCGPGHDDGEYYDVIGDAGDSDADCKVRLRLMRYCGRETFHCHILKHEDAGTMGWINVKDTSASCRVTPTYPCQISGTVSECINEYNQPNECLPWD